MDPTERVHGRRLVRRAQDHVYPVGSRRTHRRFHFQTGRMGGFDYKCAFGRNLIRRLGSVMARRTELYAAAALSFRTSTRPTADCRTGEETTMPLDPKTWCTKEGVWSTAVNFG